MRILVLSIAMLTPVAASAQMWICTHYLPQNITCEGGKTWNAKYRACE